MKKESNLISTKDELIKNFSEEQMELYNYYKSKFSYANEELYPTVREDKEMIFLEKTYKVLSVVFKTELVISLILATCVFVFGGSKKEQVKYDGSSVYFSVEDSKK